MSDDFDDAPRRTKADDRRDLVKAGCLELVRTRQGRAFLNDLIRRGGWTTLAFDPDPIRMAFNEGRRSLADEIVSTVRSFAPDQLPTLIREAFEE